MKTQISKTITLKDVKVKYKGSRASRITNRISKESLVYTEHTKGKGRVIMFLLRKGGGRDGETVNLIQFKKTLLFIRG